MKCPKCKSLNVVGDQREASAGVKYHAGRIHHGLARSGHPVVATFVGMMQVANAIHETCNITYTCLSCNHTFKKIESLNPF